MSLFVDELIARALLERHGEGLGDLRLNVHLPEHPRRLLIRLVLDSDCGRHRWIFEAGVSRPRQKRDIDKGQSLVLDFIDHYVGRWLAEERGLRPPLSYTAHRFRGADVFLRGRRRDLRAERMAAEFLGEPMEPDLEDVD